MSSWGGPEQTDEEIAQAIKFERGMNFWFSRRQPGYIDNLVNGWGEWWDDRIFLPEERGDLDE